MATANSRHPGKALQTLLSRCEIKRRQNCHQRRTRSVRHRAWRYSARCATARLRDRRTDSFRWPADAHRYRIQGNQRTQEHLVAAMQTEEIKQYFLGLQDSIVAGLEKLDGKSFRSDAWKRPQGGGGISKLIEEGKLTKPIKDVNIIGNGPDVLRKTVMVADDLVLDSGGWRCGKNGQRVPVTLGLPTIKVSEITVGGSA